MSKVRAFGEIVADILSTKAATRVKALEGLKEKVVEWPETMDDYNKVVLVLLESCKQALVGSVVAVGGKSVTLLSLQSLLVIVEDISKSYEKVVEPGTERSIPPFVSSIANGLRHLFSDEIYRRGISSEPGCLELLCRIIKQVVTGVFSATGYSPRVYSSDLVTQLSLSLISYIDQVHSRQTESIRTTVSVLIESFCGEYTPDQLRMLMECMNMQFDSGSRVRDMEFALNSLTVLIQGSPMVARKVFDEPGSAADLCRKLVSRLFGFVTFPVNEKSRNLTTGSVALLRVLFVLISSTPADLLEPSDFTQELEERLIAGITSSSGSRTDGHDVSPALLIDLVVDVQLFSKNVGYSGLINFWIDQIPASPLADLVVARLVDRFATGADWTDPAFVHSLIERCGTAMPRSTLAIVERINIKSIFSQTAVPLDRSRLEEATRGRESLLRPSVHSALQPMVAAVFPTILENILSSSTKTPSADTVLLYVQLARMEALAGQATVGSSSRLEGVLQSMLETCAITSVEEAETVAVACLYASAPTSVISPSLLSQLGKHLDPLKILRWLVCMHDEGTVINNKLFSSPRLPHHDLTSPDTLRELLSLRGLWRDWQVQGVPTSESVPGVTTRQILAQCIAIVGQTLRGTQKNCMQPALTACYIVLGSFFSSVIYDPCVLTSSLASVSKSAVSKEILRLKEIIFETTNLLLIPLRLCQCERHVDTMGEPRSLLSQGPLTSVGVESALFQNTQEIVSQRVVAKNGKKFVVSDLPKCVTKEVGDMVRKALLSEWRCSMGLETIIDVMEIDCSPTLEKIIVHTQGQSFNSVVETRIALSIIRSAGCTGEPMLHFLGDVLFDPAREICSLVLAKPGLSLLTTQFQPESIMPDIARVSPESLPGCALRVGGLHCGMSCSELLAPLLLSSPPYLVSVVDEIKKLDVYAHPVEFRRKFLAPVVVHGLRKFFAHNNTPLVDHPLHASLQLLGEETHSADLISGLSCVVSGLAARGAIGDGKDIGFVAASLLLNKSPGKPFIGSHPIGSVMALSVELYGCLKEERQLVDPIPVFQSLGGRLGNRPWLCKYLQYRCPGMVEVAAKSIDQQTAKRIKLGEDRSTPEDPLTVYIKSLNDLPTPVSDFPSLVRQSMRSVLGAALAADVFAEHTVPAMAWLASVGGAGSTSTPNPFYPPMDESVNGIDYGGSVSHPMLEISNPHRPIYASAPLNQLALSLLTDLSISNEAGRRAMAVSSLVARTAIPFLILSAVASGDREKITRVTTSINKATKTEDVSRTIVESLGVCGACSVKCGHLAITSSRSPIHSLLRGIDLAELGIFCATNSPMHAIFCAELLTRTTVSPLTANLFSEPPPALSILLNALNALGVSVTGFSACAHPSVRGLLAKLRNDYLALLFEENNGLRSEGFMRLGLEGSVRTVVSPITDPVSASQFLTTTSQSLSIMKQQLKQRSCPLSFDQIQRLNQTVELLVVQNCIATLPALTESLCQCLVDLVGVLRLWQPLKARVVADRILASLPPTVPPNLRLQLMYRLSKILWDLGLVSEATSVISALCRSEEASRLDNPLVLALLPRVLSRGGSWMTELRLAPLDEVRKKYFSKALQLSADPRTKIKTKIRIVKALDPDLVEYANVTYSVGSRKSTHSSHDTVKGLVSEEFLLLCEILASGLEGAKTAWFSAKLIGLWFQYPSITSVIFAKHRSTLAASKTLLPFIYQIAGRIGGLVTITNDENAPPSVAEFAKEIHSFLVDSAKLFPNQVLPSILQLRSQGLSSRSKTYTAQNARADADRAKQADAVIARIRTETPTVVDGTIAAFKFYLGLAMAKVVAVPPSGGTSTRAPVPKGKAVSEIPGYAEYAKFINTGNAAVLTSNDHSAKVHAIEPEYTIADSGKSMPKIVKIVDNMGKIHRQIVKGNDDLRNDAVLQQLFSLLGNEMRNYKVVPITACAGVAEWVTNTTTIGGYLVGYPNEALGAHCRYYPQDTTPTEMKNQLVLARQQYSKSSASAGGVSLEQHLLNAYNASCSKFSPCMHTFFYENFFTPNAFFNAQCAFVRSVAATSIVGFIVGLGDRHANNILIDTSSGEVIHIDYGICFDAGRNLKVPEIVPFRLTRDMVDGLGALGTQGPFAKSCEDVLEDLKKNSALITSVVEVFVVDPLFNWAVASLGSDNAQIALTEVKRKLQGFFNPTDVIPLTARAQVDRLIRSATDARNLCMMFPGWQPWL